MDNNRKKPENLNEQTRQIPAQGSASNTRQIPVQRKDEPRTDRTVPKAPASPVRNPADAPVRTPAARPIPTKSTEVKRPVPRPTPAAAPKDAEPITRQIPVSSINGTHAKSPAAKPDPEKPASPAKPLEARPATPSKPTASKPVAPAPQKAPDLSSTRQVSTAAVDRIGASKDPEGTKVMDTAMGTVSEAPAETKKKKSSDDNEGGGTAIINVIKAIIYFVSVLIVSVLISLAIIFVGNDMFAFVKSEEVVEITIPEGADVSDIATILADNGIIKYPSVFEWSVGDDAEGTEFIAGTYSVPCNLDYDDLIATFKPQIDRGTSWVTIPEGFTTDEIINLLVKSGIGTKEGYIDVINNYPFDYWFVHELDESNWKDSGRLYRLDGYLFPDTYEFYNDSTEKTVINKLLARFNVIYGKKYKEATETMGMSVDEIVIIASMIEKEAGQASDYHLVSSVFHNRLKSAYFPKMESDATVLYAIHHDTGERPTDVTGEHMKYDSPYNSYLYDGLPPGPIANPSASAINAALTPEITDYYYFVSYNVNTYFGRSNAEHEANKAMVAEMKRKAEEGNTQE